MCALLITKEFLIKKNNDCWGAVAFMQTLPNKAMHEGGSTLGRQSAYQSNCLQGLQTLFPNIACSVGVVPSGPAPAASV